MHAIHEIGGVVALASAIITDLKPRGLTIDDYGSMVVSLDSESDFFETICKFRAIRKVWAKVAVEKFGAKTKKAQLMKIGIRTSGLSLQMQKPLNNAARVTLQILSSIFGGVNSLDASSIDEAIGLPSYEARMFNLDTQHIITHEANIPLVADPLGGSYYVEWLTNYFVENCEAYLKEIDERGGIYECLESGWLNHLMEQNRLKIQREKENGQRLIIGVNSFKGEEGPINQAVANCAYKVPTEEMRRERIKEVLEFKNSRDAANLSRSFVKLYNDTKEGGNISAAVITAAKEGMTMGEMCGIVRLGYNLPYDPMGTESPPDYVTKALAG
jgi:methylmalonyl-CoA mutase N-terminal domain/subunit